MSILSFLLSLIMEIDFLSFSLSFSVSLSFSFSLSVILAVLISLGIDLFRISLSLSLLFIVLLLLCISESFLLTRMDFSSEIEGYFYYSWGFSMIFSRLMLNLSGFVSYSY